MCLALALRAPALFCGCRGRSANCFRATSCRRPSCTSVGIDDAERLHDGVTPVHGDAWNTNLSSVFHSGGFAVFDLGSASPIDAAFVEGDNNDTFFLDVSDDGKHFREIWRAGPAAGPGMRARDVQGSRPAGAICGCARAAAMRS